MVVQVRAARTMTQAGIVPGEGQEAGSSAAIGTATEKTAQFIAGFYHQVCLLRVPRLLLPPPPLPSPSHASWQRAVTCRGWAPAAWELNPHPQQAIPPRPGREVSIGGVSTVLLFLIGI